MNSISSWLIGITGVIILSVMCEFVLPEGQINKYTRYVFSFITLFMIISPVPKLLGSEFDFSNLFDINTGGYQNEFIYKLNTSKLVAITDSLNSKIEGSGILGVEVSLSANVFSDELEIYEAYVDIKNLKFDQNIKDKNVDFAKEKIEDILGYLKVPIKFVS